MNCLFIFRRDLRITDNYALIDAIEKYKSVTALFVLDPNQLESSYKSNNFIQTMCESLEELAGVIKYRKGRLNILNGVPHKIVENIIKKHKPKCVAFNLDHSNYSKERDTAIIDVCKKHEVEVLTRDDDVTIFSPELITKNYNRLYGLFRKDMKKHKVDVLHNDDAKFDNIKISGAVKDLKKFYKANPEIAVKGGRSHALSILKTAPKEFANYAETRNIASCSTTMLSNYLKNGVVSPRECYAFFVKHEMVALQHQLLWREFYFATILVKGHCYKFYDERYSRITWLNKNYKEMWSGKTGFPFVDAAVNQLNKTGFMHNRGRLMVGFFSVKILRIDPWLKKWGGQEYFSRKLIDCCYANNVGNWRWISSDTMDASGQRYGKGFSGRMMDVRDFAKFDPDGKYIRKWLPELKDVPLKHVQKWHIYYSKYKNVKYPRPIVDYDKRKKEWYEMTQHKSDK